MTTAVKSTHRTLASLKLPTKVSGLATYAQQIVTSMTGNNGAVEVPGGHQDR
jgi:hypothetical protein